MKKEVILPNREIFAICKEDIKGAFESYFMKGSYYKGLMCQMDTSTPYHIYVITDDNGYDFSLFANSEEASRSKFLKLFKIVAKKDFDKQTIFKRFDL